MVRFTERLGVVREHVEQRRPDEARHQHGHDGEQAGDARRTPRGEQEPDGDGDVERAEVSRRVYRKSGIGSEEQGRHRHTDLYERKRGKDRPQRELGLGRLGAGTESGRGRVVADRSENRRREVGNLGRGREPACSMEPLGRRGELAAPGAGVEVGFDHRGLDARVLAVETGGDGVTDSSAAHAKSVAYEGAGVPPVSSPGVDDPTRLWLDARDGDRTALYQAVRVSQADVWRLAAHLVGVNEADDVTQDTFVRAWRALPAFRGDSSARTWLLSIARRACADSIRSAMRRRRLVGRVEDERARTGDRDGNQAGAHSLQALVDGLERDQRVAFVLTQMVGCSYAEAAEVCDVPVGTIRSRVARARERLVAEVEAAETG